MNDWERLHRQAERYKQSYPPGTRVMLLSMNDPYSPVESGMRGTVQSVDDIGQLLMKWDNGRALALIPGEDGSYRNKLRNRLLTNNPCKCEVKQKNRTDAIWQSHSLICVRVSAVFIPDS